MRKLLHYCFLMLAFCIVVPTSFAQQTHRKALLDKNMIKATTPALRAAAGETTTLNHQIGCYYDLYESENKANFYVMFSENEDATFDPNTGSITAKNMWFLCLDFYTDPTDVKELPAGTYKLSEVACVANTYHVENSFAAYYDANGRQEKVDYLDGDVVVTKDANGIYTVKATTRDNGYNFTYKGKIVVQSSENTFVYDQIGADIVVDKNYKTGLAYYHGNLYQANTGNMYINIFSTDQVDTESGAMYGEGYNLSLCVFNTLFGNPEDAKIIPGTYEMGRSFKRGTYYPGMEITYIDMTMPFGTYVKRRDAKGNYAFSYISEGTIEITQAEDGSFGFNFDCKTLDGFTVKGSTEGVTFTITDMSQDTPGAHVSNLTEDVVLDLNYVKVARVYHVADKNNCGVFVVDLGSPSGKDGDEGDLIRFEFLTEAGKEQMPIGTYQMMEENHLFHNLYAPFKMVQGYFTDQGELTGTRYMHFEEGRYCVMDLLAPAIYGSVSVEYVGEGIYKFGIDLEDDAGFRITGTWEGPITPENSFDTVGIHSVYAEGTVGINYISNDIIEVCGVEETDAVEVYSATGAKVLQSVGTTLNVQGLAPGVYVLKAADYKPIKLVRK